MRLAPVQRRSIFRANARLNIWHGPVRSGKSIASLVRWLKYIDHEAPPGELYMFGKTTHAFKRNIAGPMQELVGNDMFYRTGDHVITLWGRTINVIGANDAKAEGKVRGSTSAGTYCDEISLYPADFFRMATSRMSLPGSKLFGTTNPDSPNHWLKKSYIDRAGEIDCKAFHWSIDDNEFLEPSFVAKLKEEHTGLWRKRFIDGLWVLAEGAIYDMFRQDGHIVRGDLKKPDECIIGVDYGTGNPTVFILFGIYYNHGKESNVVAMAEYYYDSAAAMRQKTDGEYADDLVDFIAHREWRRVPLTGIYIDPSAASFKTECEKHGILAVKDADNDVLNGIRTQANMLHKRRYLIHESCEQTIKDYDGYVWDPKKCRVGEDAPVKSNDHTKDAERYALHTHFGHESILYTESSMRS